MSENSTEVLLEKCGTDYDKPPFSFKQAERLAIVTIYKYGNGKVKVTQDNIDYIITDIVKGYVRFNPELMKFTNYLQQCAIFAVRRILGGRLNKQIWSLDKPISSKYGRDTCGAALLESDDISLEDKVSVNEIIEYITKSSYFSPKQRRALIGHIVENNSIDDLAKELKCHRSYIYMLIKGGIEKLKFRFSNYN